MQKGDKEVELTFPVMGLNVATEFGRQPKKTTPSGNNVQGCEPLGDRIRGGARPGVTPFLEDMTPAGDHLIQHLNVIVDPQSPALAANADIVGESQADPDPRWSRQIRVGGDAMQLNRNVTRGQTFIQKKGALQGNVSATQTITLDANPNVGDLIVVAVRMSKANSLSSPSVASVKNNGLVDYNQVGGTGYAAVASITSGTTDTYDLTMWYRVATNADDQTVKIAPGATGIMEYAICVYRGLDTSGPFTDKVKAEVATPGTTLTLANLPLDGTSGQLVVAVFGGVPSATGVIGSSGYSARFALGSTASNLYVLDKTSASGAAPETVTVTRVVTAEGYVGIAAAFTR